MNVVAKEIVRENENTHLLWGEGKRGREEGGRGGGGRERGEGERGRGGTEGEGEREGREREGGEREGEGKIVVTTNIGKLYVHVLVVYKNV